MTTNPLYEASPEFNSIEIIEISSDVNEDWLHPILEIFRPEPAPVIEKSEKLYLVPTSFGDEFDPEFAPVPTSAEDLPELSRWCEDFARNVLEVYAGKRPPKQLTSLFHHRVYVQLLEKSGSQKEIGKIRKLHVTQPLIGICEATMTVRFGARLRALVFRFEGVDKRWLCTSLTLL
ncbi:unannotated protein [freshwater metagenome]|uniref:Unannotated protein n=1 Tax=freshwater metagenome TaxID=449393 RepID=A0A6J6PMR8_9ZZZZ|nr:hypothetical protein [Actinomycetota bacterium]MSW62788.1 hypothetical protein [Actinomycetota bacterium]MSX89876.1 hypothetical protein [Actinomycetota bacterium]MSZ63468.1 hypothetical protein [Actinomycetota bacterium]MTA58314.1 hypothetical protein [Actinomycetota bacterium]